MVFPSILVHHPAMYWKMSAESGTSATRATARGLPLSSDSSSASSSLCFAMRSPIRHTSLLRSEGVIAGHGPDSNARRAAGNGGATGRVLHLEGLLGCGRHPFPVNKQFLRRGDELRNRTGYRQFLHDSAHVVLLVTVQLEVTPYAHRSLS